MLSQIGLEKFDFLRKMALEAGAVDAKIITTDKIQRQVNQILGPCVHIQRE